MDVTWFHELVPDEPKGPHADGLQIRVSVGLVITVGECIGKRATNLLVISNVVPKIWARTNSAMRGGVGGAAG